MDNDLLDVLVAGIGGAAGASAQQAAEEVSFLRKTSLAQLNAQSGKEPDTDLASSRLTLEQLRNKNLVDQDTFELLDANPEMIQPWLESAVGEGSTTALTEATETAGRYTLGERQVQGAGDAQQTATELAAGDELNIPEARGSQSSTEEAARIRAALNLDIPQARGAVSSQETQGELAENARAGVPAEEGRQAGEAEASKLDTLFGYGFDSTKYADTSTSTVDVVKNVQDTWQASNPLWDRAENPITQAATNTVNSYLVERSQELLDQGLPKNRVNNILTEEAKMIAQINMEDLMSDTVLSASEAQDKNIRYKVDMVPQKVQELRTIIQGEEPSASSGGAGTDTNPGAGRGSPAPSPVGQSSPQVAQPSFLQNLGQGAPTQGESNEVQTGPRVREDGGVNLSTPTRGNIQQVETQVQDRLIKYLEDRQNNEAAYDQARELVANIPPSERNGLSVQEYIQQMIGRLIVGSRG